MFAEMKSLYLLRHAHALAEAPPGMGDHERPLSDRGAAEAEKAGLYMRENAFEVDFILSSSSARTGQTARIVANSNQAQGQRVEEIFDRGLYLAPAGMIVENIRAVKNRYCRLLVVGHNPGIAELAMRLSGGQVVEFPPATLAVFEIEASDWNEFDLGKIRLKDVFMPDQ